MAAKIVQVHKVLLELEDANHHSLDKGTVTFVVPGETAAEKQRPNSENYSRKE
jgi:Family of unknown function (DUF6130)